MPPRIKSAEEREKLRTSILDAARTLFVERGIEAVSMREIAKNIGYSPTTLYHHFADKDALLQAVCDEDFLKLADSMREIMKIPDLVWRIRALAQGYAMFALQNPSHYRLMFMMPRTSCNPDTTVIQRGNTEQDAYAQLKQVVKDAFQADLFRKELTDDELIAQTLWAGIHGVCSLEISLGREDWIQWGSVQARLALMQKTMLQGLLRHPAFANDERQSNENVLNESRPSEN